MSEKTVPSYTAGTEAEEAAEPELFCEDLLSFVQEQRSPTDGTPAEPTASGGTSMQTSTRASYSPPTGRSKDANPLLARTLQTSSNLSLVVLPGRPVLICLT